MSEGSAAAHAQVLALGSVRIVAIRPFSREPCLYIDVFSRRVVGWRLSKRLRTDLSLNALEMGLLTRRV